MSNNKGYSLRNLADKIVWWSGKGLFPRDRILSAISIDGKNWQREEGVRIEVGWGFPADMVYYPYVVELSEGKLRMYFYGARKTRNGWHGGIYSALSYDGLVWQIERGIRLHSTNMVFRAPVVYKDGNANWHIFFVQVNPKNESSLGSAISDDGLLWKLTNPPKIALLPEQSIVDLDVVELQPGQLRLYFSVSDGIRTTIRSATSTDGNNYALEKGVRIPNQKGMKLVANNPNVYLGMDGQWNMIFRGGDQHAIGDSLFHASSHDGRDWEVTGEILRPDHSHSFERHGLGFPNVHYLDSEKMRLYYTGYWGKIWREERTVNMWGKINEEAISGLYQAGLE